MNQIAVICSEFNKKLVEELYHTAEQEFKEHSQFFSTHYPNCELKQIWVPGAGEIPLGIKCTMEQQNISSNSKMGIKTAITKSDPSNIIGVLALGVIIRGQTGHYDFLNGFLQKALWDLQKTYSFPILFSVLMLENRDQAQDRIIRAKESMKALIKMLKLKHQGDNSE